MRIIFNQILLIIELTLKYALIHMRSSNEMKVAFVYYVSH